MENFNSSSNDIKFTDEFHREKIYFFDFTAISSYDKLMNNVYTKPTDCHQ